MEYLSNAMIHHSYIARDISTIQHYSTFVSKNIYNKGRVQIHQDIVRDVLVTWDSVTLNYGDIMGQFGTRSSCLSLVTILIFSGLTLWGFTLPSAEGALTASSPTSGDMVSGTVTFTLIENPTAADAMALYIDGGLVSYMSGTGTDPTTWTYDIDTSVWDDGPHSVRYDALTAGSVTDSLAIFVTFDNGAPLITEVDTIYPMFREFNVRQTAARDGDQVTIRARVSETWPGNPSGSGVTSVSCDTSYISNVPSYVMFDDGNHYDDLSGDGVYGTPLITVTNPLIGYHPVFITATDGSSNQGTGSGEVGIDAIDPQITQASVAYPTGHTMVKNSDFVRVKATVLDDDPSIDVVLVMDKSGSMTWTEDYSWRYFEYDVSTYVAGDSNVQLRFTYDIDPTTWLFSGWNIDDVTLAGDVSGTLFSADLEDGMGDNSWSSEGPGGGNDWESKEPGGYGGTDTGDEGGPDPASAHSGTDVLGAELDPNGNYVSNSGNCIARFTTGIDCSSENTVTLGFWRWLNCGSNVDKPTGYPTAEHMVQIKDQAGTWHDVWENYDEKLEDSKDAAVDFVNNQGPNDRTALVTFSDSATLDNTWTSVKTDITTTIDNMDGEGGTALWDATRMGAQYADTSTNIRAMVILTDGSDTASFWGKDDAIAAIQTAEVPTFVIGMGSGAVADDLQDLANAYPGGSYYFAPSSADLDTIYDDISFAIKNIRSPGGVYVTYVNATEIGGPEDLVLYDDGLHDDFTAGDSIYGSDLIPVTFPGSGTADLTVHALDVAGRKDSWSLQVQIDNDIVQIADPEIVYPGAFERVADGECINVQATVTDPQSTASVYVDATEIGGTSHVDMSNDTHVFTSIPIEVTTGNSTGWYVLTIHAVDGAGNTATHSINVYVDNSQPIAARLISPTENETIEGAYVFRAYANDEAGVSRVELMVNDDGIWREMTFSGGYYETTVETVTAGLSDGGRYPAKVRAYDTTWEESVLYEMDFGFYVDNTAPVVDNIDVSGLNVTSLGYLVQGSFFLNISIDDAGGIPPAVSAWDKDTGEVIALTQNGSLWQGNWNTSTADDGQHTIRIEVTDSSGNTVYRELKVVVDNNPPSTTVNLPIPNQFLSGDFNFRVFAADGAGVENVLLTIHQNTTRGVVLENVSMIPTTIPGIYEYPIDTRSFNQGMDGNYGIQIFVEDIAGRSVLTEEVPFQIDNNPPRLTVASPISGDIVEGILEWDYLAMDAFLETVEYQINGGAWLNITTPWNTTTGKDGTYTIRVRALDLSGQQTLSQEITVQVDNNDPATFIQAPGMGEFLEGYFTFRVSATDANGISSVQLGLFGTTFFMVYNPQSGYYEYTFDTRLWDDGVYQASATVSDSADHVSEIGPVTFVVDNNDPTLSINSPVNNAYVGGMVDFQLAAHDTNDTFDLEVFYNVDDTGWVNSSVPWNTSTVKDGQHGIVFKAVDRAGRTVLQSLVLYVDNNQPTGIMVSPIMGEFVEDKVSFQVLAQDEFGVEQVVVHAFSMDLECSYNAQSGNWEAAYQINQSTEEGEQACYASVYDRVGHMVDTQKVLFNVDYNPPNLETLTPRGGQYVSGTVNVTVKVTEINFFMSEYRVDGGTWYRTTQTWDTTQVVDGEHTLTVRALDKAGHSTEQTITVIVDNNDPEALVQNPTLNEYISGVYVFRVMASDTIGIDHVRFELLNLTVNATFRSGAYEYSLFTTMVPDGKYSLKVMVVDLAGRSVELDTITFHVDNNDPTLTVNDPHNGDILSGAASLDVGSDDAFPGTLQYQVDQGPFVGVTQPVNTSDYADGQHTITVRSTDMAGHVTQSTVTVTFDNTPAEAFFVSPAPDQVIGGKVEIRLQTRDQGEVREVRFQVDTGEERMMEESQDDLFTLYLDTNILEEGAHRLSVKVTDRAGHTTEVSETVTVDNRGPSIGIQSPKGTVNEQVEFTFNVTDPSGVSYIYLNIDSTGWRELPRTGELASGGEYYYLWETTWESNGEHVFEVRAQDTMGNEITHVGSFVVEIEKPAEDTNYYQALLDATPLLALIFIILIIALFFLLMRRGSVRDWMHRDGDDIGSLVEEMRRENDLKQEALLKEERRPAPPSSHSPADVTPAKNPKRSRGKKGKMDKKYKKYEKGEKDEKDENTRFETHQGVESEKEELFDRDEDAVEYDEDEDESDGGVDWAS